MNKTSRKASQKFTRKRSRKDPKVRFFKHVNKTDTCWFWESCGSGPRGAYGGFNDGERKVKAHRFSWELHRGPIPEGMCVLHKCDNPRCVNPDHLFLGTMSDNTQDMIKKRRHYTVTKPEFILRGSEANPAKLNEKQVFQIRRLSLKGVSGHRIAHWCGMSRSSINRAISGTQWAHIPFPRHVSDTLEAHN